MFGGREDPGAGDRDCGNGLVRLGQLVLASWTLAPLPGMVANPHVPRQASPPEASYPVLHFTAPAVGQRPSDPSELPSNQAARLGYPDNLRESDESLLTPDVTGARGLRKGLSRDQVPAHHK